MSRTTRNIYCIEGDWWGGSFQRTTVRPIFELVAQMFPSLDYIHRRICTRAEFDYCVKTFAQRRHSKYPLLYLAFHGSPEGLHIGDNRRSDSYASFDHIAELLDGQCSKRVIHFGSCSTLACDKRRIKKFLRETGALAVVGYEYDIGWIEAASFEVNLLSQFQQNSLTVHGIRAVRNRINSLVRQQAQSLGFRMVISGD